MKISLKAVQSDWKRKRLLYLFGTGMILGMISMHLGKKVLLTRTGLLDQDSLYHLRYISVSGNALFWYVCLKRAKSAALLAILATTWIGSLAVTMTAFFYGAGAGMFLSAAILRYGAKGILLVLAAIFPQCLFYIPAIVFLFVWCDRASREYYRKVNALVLIAGLLLLGCFFESYLNPAILNALLRRF